MAAQVDRDGLMARRKMCHLRIPIRVRAGKAVHEDEGWAAGAGHPVMQKVHGRSIAGP